MKIRGSQAVRRDVRSLKRYIAQDSPFYAKQFSERLIATIDKSSPTSRRSAGARRKLKTLPKIFES